MGCSKFMRRTTTRLWGLLLACLVSAHAFPAQDINALKAAYIFYFAKFVNWDSGRRNNIVVCLNTHNQALEHQFNGLEGRPVGHKKLSVKELDQSFSGALSEQCDVLYSDMQLDTQNLDLTDVLVVAESHYSNSIINFTIDQGKLSFDIDAGRANSQNVQISSRLLQLARKVYR